MAITARTVHDGDPTAYEPDTGAPLPGSLTSTASAIGSRGRRAVPIRLDLLDLDSLAPAVDDAIGSLGHLDVLVNNAIFVGPGANRRFLETRAGRPDPSGVLQRHRATVDHPAGRRAHGRARGRPGARRQQRRRTVDPAAPGG